MVKHAREGEDDRPVKRRKETNVPEIRIEIIEHPRQLQQLLTFNQNGVHDLRNGLASFKAFLEEILYKSDDGKQNHRLHVLTEFLDAQKPADNTEDRPFLGQLWQAWSFANQNNNDHLASAICALFALLLKTLATLINLKHHASLLCRTVLQHQHLRLIKRCLDAPRHKDFLLSPSLRLLNEVLNFDGGTLARELYRRREQSFDVTALRKCLSIVKENTEADEVWKKPAVRTSAVRYILSHLKLQGEGEKTDILKQKPICLTLFSFFRDDPPEVILDILRTSEQYVLKDVQLSRSAKAALLTEKHLERVTDIATRAEINEEVTREALQWLRAVCENPSYGILRSSGWYPPGTTRIGEVADPGAIDLGLDSLDFWENEDKFEIRNTILAAWIKNLRPNSDLRERDLILAAFRSAPELVHAYFRDNALQMDPKLTNTWLGYASFMFEVARLPVPAHLGNTDSNHTADVPPQTSIVMDSIFPRPMVQKVFTKCLNQNIKLISHFAVSFLVVALTKVRSLLNGYDKANYGMHAQLWLDAKKRVLAAVSSTCPSLKQVVTLFKSLPDDEEHLLQREMITRLIKLYFEVLPDDAHAEMTDVTSSLVSTLSAVNSKEDRNSWRSKILNNLLAISAEGPGMRWFQKHDGLSMSPVTIMLQSKSETRENVELDGLLARILTGAGILTESVETDKPSPYDALVLSLRSQPIPVWRFLDDCFNRLTTSAIKYLDNFDSLTTSTDGESVPSLLVLVLLEQASFVLNKESKERKAIMQWINTFLSYLALSSDDGSPLQAISLQITSMEGWSSRKAEIDRSLLKRIASTNHVHQENIPSDQSNQHFELPFDSIPEEKPDHPELFRWQKKDLDIAIEDGDVANLVLCLSSSYEEIRRQARSQCSTLMMNLQQSSVQEKDQLYLLVGELLETYDISSVDHALPYIASTLACRALEIQLDPTHFMYSKLNAFLMRGPEWRVSRLPAYWIAKTYLAEPSEDDAYWKEIQWVIEWLIDGLRTLSDLDILRQSGTFERLMTIYSSPAAPEKLVRESILELLHRAAQIDAKTLVTRTGIISWLEMLRGKMASSIRQIVLSKCDASALQAWSGVKIVA